jgi:hypothetical protein
VRIFRDENHDARPPTIPARACRGFPHGFAARIGASLSVPVPAGAMDSAVSGRRDHRRDCQADGAVADGTARPADRHREQPGGGTNIGVQAAVGAAPR